MKKIFVYMPCYIGNNNRFKKELTATIKSLEQYPNIFKKIKLFICQKNKRKTIQELVDKLSLLGLVLEAPSLIPSFIWKKMLKPGNFDVLYVIHLSQNSYV